MYYIYLYFGLIILISIIIYFCLYYYLTSYLQQLNYEYYPKHIIPETRFKYRPQKIYEYYDKHKVKLEMITTRIQDKQIINKEKVSPKSFFNTNFNLTPQNKYHIKTEYNNLNLPQFLGVFMNTMELDHQLYPKINIFMTSNNWSSNKFELSTESRYIFQMYGEQEIYLINCLDMINDDSNINKIEKINLGEGDLLFIPHSFVFLYKGLKDSKNRNNQLFFEILSPRNKFIDFLISCLYKKKLSKYF